MKNFHFVIENDEMHQSGVVSSGSDENAGMRSVQFTLILLNLGGKVIVVPRFRDFCDAFIFHTCTTFSASKMTQDRTFRPESKLMHVLKQKR